MPSHEPSPYDPLATPLLTIAEVADRLAVSRATVRRLMKAGALPRVVVGGSLRFEAADVARLIERAKVPTAEASPPWHGVLRPDPESSPDAPTGDSGLSNHDGPARRRGSP